MNLPLEHRHGEDPNGFAVVWVVMRLREGVPLQEGVIYELDVAVDRRLRAPRLNLHSNGVLPESTSGRIPVPANAGQCYLSLFSEVALNIDGLGGSETLRIATKRWRKASLPTKIRRSPLRWLSLRRYDRRTFFAELVGRWHITLGCDLCVKTARNRSVTALLDTVTMIARAASWAMPIPFSVLPNLVQEPVTVHVTTWDLVGGRRTALRPERLRALDPRVVVIEGQVNAAAQPGHVGQRMLAAIEAIQEPLDVGPYFAFIGDAAQALYVHDSPSSCVVLAAQGCEALVSFVRLHMSWWDRLSWRRAGEQLHKGVVARAKLLEPLGGQWEADKAGPVGDWKRDVADVRNRVAHGGLGATFDEAERALTSARSLHSYLEEIAIGEPARTAYAVLGDLLRADLGWRNPAMLEYLKAAVDPVRSFHHYRALAQRNCAQRFGNPAKARVDFAELWAEVSNASDTVVKWWAYDPECHYIAEAEAPNISPARLGEFVSACQPKIRVGRSTDTFRFRSDSVIALKRSASWLDALTTMHDLVISRP